MDGPKELVLANRILAREGILDAFGHVSIRDAKDPNVFVVSRSLAPALVTEADLQWLDLDRHVVRGDTRSSYAETAIHAELYHARPDVRAVVHCHAPSLIPFGVSTVPLRPIFHMGSLIGTTIPVWDIRAEFGETDMLVKVAPTGASLARALGPRQAALMRGHGAVIVGAHVAEAVRVTLALEINARLQQQALALGDVGYLSDAETERARAMLLEPLSSERAWGWLVSRL